MSKNKPKHLCPEKYCHRKKGQKKAYCHHHHAIKQKEKDPVRYQFNVNKGNAKRRGKVWGITLDYFREFLSTNNYMDDKGRFKTSLTIDRDKEHLGYVPGNLVIRTNDDNRKKYVEYHRNKKQEEDDIVVGDLDQVDF